MVYQYHVCFWFSEETFKSGVPDYQCDVAAQLLDVAVIQAMQSCGVASVANVLWWQVALDGDVPVGGWRFGVSLGNPVGMYAE